MHYYQFNIADYRKDTGPLSSLKHAIYRSLIDWYYLDESPIPLETQSVMRRLRLVSEAEAKALENVLSDFFFRADGWRHKRIDQDIIEYHAMAEKNKANGKLGGRPKKTQSVSVGMPSGNPNESQNNPNQEPITNNQEPILKPLPSASLPVAAKEKVETELQSVCRETWSAYSVAYELRYGAAPLRNVKVSAQVKSFVQRVGKAESAIIAEWFVSHPGDYYAKNLHSFGLLLADAEKLRTQWATGRIVHPSAKTQYQINQEATASAFFGNSSTHEPRLISGEVIS